jgi:hypothetical protein
MLGGLQPRRPGISPGGEALIFKPMIFEPKRCRGAAGDESGEARAELNAGET